MHALAMNPLATASDASAARPARSATSSQTELDCRPLARAPAGMRTVDRACSYSLGTGRRESGRLAAEGCRKVLGSPHQAGHRGVG